MSYRLIPIFLLSMAAACAPAQPMYPTISKANQKVRDDDRLPLLESELAFERNALEKAKHDLAAVPTNERSAAVHRHEENIKALRREIGAVAAQDEPEKSERPVVKAIRVKTPLAESKKAPNFWDPYNRAPDSNDFSTSPRRDSHE